jgi:hypothetical protein
MDELPLTAIHALPLIEAAMDDDKGSKDDNHDPDSPVRGVPSTEYTVSVRAMPT